MKETTENRQILVVDDDQMVRMLMREGLLIERGWDVATASGGEEALQKIRAQSFDLVITDLRMPGMHGLELIRHIRDISPATQIVLLTAYSSKDAEHQAADLSVHDYLIKPVPIPEIRRIAREALEKTARVRQETASDLVGEAEQDELSQHLILLNQQTGARSVLLTSSAGYLISQAGVDTGVNVQSLAALVAANVAAMAEVTRLLGSAAVFKSFFQEGEDFNIYAHVVGEDAILIVIARPEVKTGIIWFYARQAAHEMGKLVQNLPQPSLADLDLAAFDASLENVLNFEPVPVTPPLRVASPQPPAAKTVKPQQRGAEPPAPALLNLEAAIAQGLIPAELLGDSGAA
ncbi:MAG TPA: response regulator [Thermoflexia bacterium]|nr:response regulator [Thermoflexia bacterium]